MTKQAHVADYKKKVVAELTALMREYPIIAAVNMENLPTPQLQSIRASIRQNVVLRMAKRRLIKIAIDQVKSEKKGIAELEPYLTGMPALIFTSENPFTLFKSLKKSKSKAPAKAGQTAPNDIIVKAGPTPFSPGPIISELGSVGIKSGIEGGKVSVKEDAVVVREDEVIKQKVAELLTRLGITPMEVGLNLTAAFENGIILRKQDLDIDEEKFIADVASAARWAVNLAVEAGYHTKEVIELMITKAFRDSKALALEQNILADAVAGPILAKAEAHMNALRIAANITVVEKPKQAADQKENSAESGAAKTTEEKVAEMVQATKDFAAGKKEPEGPSAEALVDEAKAEDTVRPKSDAEKVPSAHELAKKAKKK